MVPSILLFVIVVVVDGYTAACDATYILFG
jgi:hypothetical protein